jgi:hypothetical protein
MQTIKKWATRFFVTVGVITTAAAIATVTGIVVIFHHIG